MLEAPHFIRLTVDTHHVNGATNLDTLLLVNLPRLFIDNQKLRKIELNTMLNVQHFVLFKVVNQYLGIITPKHRFNNPLLSWITLTLMYCLCNHLVDVTTQIQSVQTLMKE